jgi:ABC-type dipeptide/oligopeptide/nickel transport system ATPase component
MPDFIFDVHGLKTTFKTPDGVIHAVNRISFRFAKGGCGKSVNRLSALCLILSLPTLIIVETAFAFIGDGLRELPDLRMRGTQHGSAA